MKQTSQVNPGTVPAIRRAAVIDQADLDKVSGGGGARGGVSTDRAQK
jgi:hypothetical protein